MSIIERNSNKPTLNEPTQALNSSNKTSSWKSYAKGATYSMAALGALAYLGYQNFYSPSLLHHNSDENPLHSLYAQHVTSCDDNTFKAFQIFYNTFESPLYYLGLHSINNPPGDFTAFVLDQNFKGAQCSYASYTPMQLTQRMKNTLLGEVMRRQALLKKDLSFSIQWLVNQGADPSYFHPIKIDELQKQQAASYTPLLSAFDTKNIDLYKDLLEKGASVDTRLSTYSTETEKWDQRETLIQEIVKRIMSQSTISDDDCKTYKTIIDLSIAKHNPDIHSFDLLSNQELETLIYRTIISEANCWKHFKIKEEHKSQNRRKKDQNSNSWEDFLNKSLYQTKVLLAAFQKLWTEYFPDISPAEQTEMFKILKLDPEKLALMKKEDAISAIKKACRTLKAENHPDKPTGNEEFFKKVAESCEKILNEYKGK